MRSPTTTLLAAALLGLAWLPARGQSTQPAEPQAADIAVPDIDFTSETLDNGLRVVYAPMDNAPVVHVRVLYHVGSKDEQHTRRGFAHLFEHMMFRGSEHVPSEQHMKLVNGVGGNSNAFTSFDQTAYVNTVPSNALEMALWLEADRMASFKVDAETFTTERSVVNEEYLQRVANPPYGRQSIDFFGLAFSDSHYQWTPIGDMEQLAASTVGELQDFFDTYYVPKNAVLVIAGQFDVEQAKAWVKEYFGWMEPGGELPRPSPREPEQTEVRRRTVYAERAPLPSLTLAFKTPSWGDADVTALEVLGNILGQGRSSRMYQALVAGSNGEPPVAASASAGLYRLEDAGLMYASVMALADADPEATERRTMAVIKRIAEEGVSEGELAKAKTQLKLGLLRDMQTADTVAGNLAEAWAFAGDPAYANKRVRQIDAVTTDDIARVAATYLDAAKVSTLIYLPGRDPAEQQADANAEQLAAEAEAEAAEVVATQPATRQRAAIDFPDDYPTQAPVPEDVVTGDFNTGESFDVGGVETILIRDSRLPLVGMTLLMPAGGGDALPKEQTGLASLVADLVTRGAGGRDAQTFSELLDARGISLSASDGGDHTALAGSFPKQAIDDAAGLANDLLTSPNLDEGEFRNLQARAAAGLQQALSDPTGVSQRELDAALFGDAPAGRDSRPEIIARLTLDDVKRFFTGSYRPKGATLILAGDLDRAEAEAFAKKLLDGWAAGDETLGDADYALDDYQRQILLVDNPGGGQSAVRLGNRSFTVASDQKYAASVATQILSGGIESRLNQALRAEKGLTYGARGSFDPGRHSGEFSVGFATRPETTGEAVRTAFEVLERMATEPVTPEELADAQRRVAGSLVLSQQTVGQLARLRGNIVLNGYPLDYYNAYGTKIADVTASDVMRVIADYGRPEQLSIVVVAPAEVAREQLAEFGEVKVVPMPLAREAK